MRKILRGRVSLLMLCILLVGSVVALVAVHTSASAASQQSSGGVKPPTAHSPVGVSAIQPTLPGQIPAFTIADVQKYLANHPFPGGLTTSGHAPAVTRIAFMTKEQASATMAGESLDELPDGSLVCYVAFQGPFSGNNIDPPPDGAKPGTFQIGEMVFDAQTGNLLGWGLR